MERLLHIKYKEYVAVMACVCMMLFAPSLAQSQQKDSLRVITDSISHLMNKNQYLTRFDSVNRQANSKIDSVQSLLQKKVTTQPDLHQIASKLSGGLVKKERKDKTDSTKNSIEKRQQRGNKITSLPGEWSEKITNPDLFTFEDKLRKKDTLGNPLEGKDSITQQTQQQLSGIKSTLSTNEQKWNEKINQPFESATEKINAPVEKVNTGLNAGLNKLSNEAMGKSDLPGQVNLPGISSSVPSSGSLTKNLPNATNVLETKQLKEKSNDILNEKKGEANIDKLKGEVNDPLKKGKDEGGKLNKELNEKVQGKMNHVTDNKFTNKVEEHGAELNEATDKLQGYSKDVEEIKKGNWEEAQEIKNEVAEKLPMEEFKDAKGQLGALEEEKEKLKALQNKEAFKKQTIAKAREEVVQQIIAQHSKMMETVDKISIYQKQGGALAGMVKGLPTRPLKSRKPPFIERFIPGMTLQVQKGSYWLVDINPTLRFRVRSILSVGAGYNYRLAMDKSGKTRQEEQISGIRSFMEFSVRKGLSIRGDVERMSAYVPLLKTQPDVRERKYVWSYMIGLRKDFGLGAGVLGNVQFMYNIYDPKKESPYLNRLNVRFGFEVPFKKSKIKKNKS